MIQDPIIRTNQGDPCFSLVSRFSPQLLSIEEGSILSSEIETLELPPDGTAVASLADEIEIVVVTSGGRQAGDWSLLLVMLGACFERWMKL